MRRWSSPSHRSTSSTPCALQCRAEALGDVFDPRLRVGTGNVEVAVRGQLLEGADLAAVGRAPPEHDPDLVDLVAEAAREDEAVDPEAGQDLGQLERMAEAVGHVADRRGSAPNRLHTARPMSRLRTSGSAPTSSSSGST